MIIMKKLFLILFVISAFNLNAQYITKHAKNLKKDINEEGIFYYLPQNIIRIDFKYMYLVIIAYIFDFSNKSYIVFL